MSDDTRCDGSPLTEGSGLVPKRAAFEAWFADSRRSRGAKKRPNFERLPDGTYADDHTQRHWWTWQTAQAARIEADAAEIARLRAEVAEWEKLRDPALLHAALLRGLPAHLDRDAFLHLAGADALRADAAEIERLRAALVKYEADDVRYLKQLSLLRAEVAALKRVAEAAQAVTNGAEDIGDFLVSSSLMAALALALDERAHKIGGA